MMFHGPKPWTSAPERAEREMERPCRYLLTGGGTAGHVYPALALAEHIRQKEPEACFLYVGAKGGAEERVVPPAGYALETLPVRGLPTGRSILRLAGVMLRLAQSVLRSFRILWRFRPDVIVGSGGYASSPVLLAALVLRSVRLWKGVLALHEQNILPGRFNRWMSRWADFTGAAFPDTAQFLRGDNVFWTGYPVRNAIRSIPEQGRLREQARKEFDIPAGARVVLVFGGSTGARTINRAVLGALPLLVRHKDLYVFHATGHPQGDYDPEREILDALSHLPGRDDLARRYRWRRYFHDIQKFYSMADFVVCRAGAGSIFEVATLGIPALLVPKAGLPGDHQVKNARFLERSGLARIVYERRDPLSPATDPEKVDTEDFNRLLAALIERAPAEARERSRGKLEIPDGSQRFYEILVHFRQRARSSEIAPPRPPSGLEAAAAQRGLFRLEWWNLQKLLLFLERQWSKSIPLTDEDRRYVEYLADRLLCARRWQERNAGVKLAGLVRFEKRLPILLQFITDRTPAPRLQRLLGGDFVQVGFIRRNSVQAIRRIRKYDAEVRRALLTALTDPYYEVRSWAARTIEAMAEQIGPDPEIESLLRKNLRDRWFEVAASSLDALGRVAKDPAVLPEVESLLESKNGRVQHAALRCLMHLIERDVVRLSSETRRWMNRIPMRGVDFSPQFPLKSTWEAFQKVLSQKSALPDRKDEDVQELEKQRL